MLVSIFVSNADVNGNNQLDITHVTTLEIICLLQRFSAVFVQVIIIEKNFFNIIE